MSTTEAMENQASDASKNESSPDHPHQSAAHQHNQDQGATSLSSAAIQQAQRLSQRNMIKRNNDVGKPEEKSLSSMIQGNKGKGLKLELTEAEKELLMGNDFSSKMKENDSNGSAGGSPTNMNTGKRKRRGDDDGIETGGRVRRPKTNFSEDFVYDDIVMRNSITQKGAKESLAGTQQGAQPQAQKAKKQAPKKQKSTMNTQISILPQIHAQQQPHDSQMHLQPHQATAQNQPPIRLYCICRTADESAQMIGCDKCDEWYHFECVGIDISQIPDIESFEFVCPECQKKTSKQGNSKKSLAANMNKRNAKAASKKVPQNAQIQQQYDYNQQQPNNTRIVVGGGGQSQQIQSASVQQKRKFQKSRQQMQQQMNQGGNSKSLGGKKQLSAQKKQGQVPHGGKMVLSTNLGGNKFGGQADYGNQEFEDEDQYMDEDEFHHYEDEQREDYSESHDQANTGVIPQRLFDGHENQMKKLNDNNIEKVVQKGEYLYFITKDGKDKPIESHFKMQVPDKRLQITDDQIPNLKNLLLKPMKKETGEELKDQENHQSLNQMKSAVDQISEILKEKLKMNLKKIPSVYSFSSNYQQQVTINQE